MADRSRRRLMADPKERNRIRQEEKELKDVKRLILELRYKGFSNIEEKAFVEAYGKEWLLRRYENAIEIEKLYGKETMSSYYLGGLGFTLEDIPKLNLIKVSGKSFLQGILDSK